MVGIVSNSAALFAQRNLATASSSSEASIARLSSGNAIVSAADDVAGLAIGTVLRTTVSTLKTILSSTAQATSLLGIADAGLQNIGEILQRQKSLSVQANTGSLSDNERAFLDQEFQSLVSEIDRIVTNTTFNGIALLDGSIGGASSSPVTSVVTADLDFTVTGTVVAATAIATSGAAAAAITVSSLTVADHGENVGLAGATSDIQANAVWVSNNNIGITVVLDGEVYTDSTVNLAGSASLVLSHSAGAGTITIALSEVVSTGTGVSDQAGANTLAAAIEAAFANLQVQQKRELEDDSTGIQSSDTTGTTIEGMTGAAFKLQNNSLTALDATAISGFVVSHEATGSSDGMISVTINGNNYRTAAGLFDGTANQNLGDTNYGYDFASGGSDAGTIRLYRNGDATAYQYDYFDIDFDAMTTDTIDLDDAADATALETALNTVFGGGGSLTFQVGTTASDSISLSLDGSATTDIYLNDAGTYAAQNVATSTAAQTASDVLDNAINTVTSLRATIGALQSRFNFAASSVNSSIQNTEAARAIFLDVDIAEESTAFATAQVRLQASISVLAQANLIPQNLLKLIG